MEEFARPVMAATPAIQLIPAQPPPPPAAPAPAPKKDPAPKEKEKEKAKDKAKEEKAKEKDKAKADAGAPAAAQAVPPPAVPAAQPVQVAQAIGFARRSGFGANFNGLSMVDAKGQGHQLVGVQSQAQSDGKTIKYQYTLTYKVAKDQGDPAKLTFSGSKLATVEVPFNLKDVPLPVSLTSWQLAPRLSGLVFQLEDEAVFILSLHPCHPWFLCFLPLPGASGGVS